MTYQKVEGGYRSVKAQNQRRGNNQPVILYERNLNVLVAMFDYAAFHNDCRVNIKDDMMATKGCINDVVLSIEATYNYIRDYDTKSK